MFLSRFYAFHLRVASFALYCNKSGGSCLTHVGTEGYTNLKTIRLEANQISSLDAGQFQGLTNLSTLRLQSNQISSMDANQFQGLTNLGILRLQYNQISSLAANQFQDLANLQTLDLFRNQIALLDLTGFEAVALTNINIDRNPITEVILADTTLSQTTFDALMTGHEDDSVYIGIAELAGITSVDFTGADMTGVNQFDEMFDMPNLKTLILTDALFSDWIIMRGYAEMRELIFVLDRNQLDALTVDRQLYAAMQTNLDTWDAGPGNVLTVVPEPSTLALLAVASLVLLLWRRKATSR